MSQENLLLLCIGTCTLSTLYIYNPKMSYSPARHDRWGIHQPLHCAIHLGLTRTISADWHDRLCLNCFRAQHLNIGLQCKVCENTNSLTVPPLTNKSCKLHNFVLPLPHQGEWAFHPHHVIIWQWSYINSALPWPFAWVSSELLWICLLGTSCLSWAHHASLGHNRVPSTPNHVTIWHCLSWAHWEFHDSA